MTLIHMVSDKVIDGSLWSGRLVCGDARDFPWAPKCSKCSRSNLAPPVVRRISLAESLPYEVEFFATLLVLPAGCHSILSCYEVLLELMQY